MRPKIKITPTDFQVEVHNAVNLYRTTIMLGGRGVGKTIEAIFELVHAVFKKPKQKVLYACHSISLADEVYNALNNDAAIKRYIKRSANRPNAFIEFTNGSVIKFWSMKRAEEKRGFRAHFLVLDECGLIKKQAWETILKPVLSAWRGKALLLSSATGTAHWFHALYQKGVKCEDNYKSFKFTSYRGICYQGAEGRAELQREKRGTSWENFQQEYLCKFLNTAGGKAAFREKIIQDCLYKPDEIKHNPKDRTLLLYDIGGGGEKQDPSGIIILDKFCRVLHEEVLQVKGLVNQLQYVASLEKKFNSQIVVESNGTNRDNLISLLTPHFMRKPKDIGINPKSKPIMVELLRVAMERKVLQIPESCTELIRQLKLWQVVDTGKSSFTFTHPDGDHDDLCTALLIGITALFQERIISPAVQLQTIKRKQGRLF